MFSITSFLVYVDRESNSAPLIDFGESNGNTTSSSQEMSERLARQFGDMGTNTSMTLLYTRNRLFKTALTLG